MNILVGIHIGSDWNDGGINCAKIDLTDAAIESIFKLAKKAKKGRTIVEYNYTPELGTSYVDLQNESPYRNIADLSPMMGDNEVFTSKQSDDNEDPIRTDCVQLHIDSTDFWWEGMFKHTDIHWETRMIPLNFLPQPKSKVSLVKPEVELTETGINNILEKISTGVSGGLNSREIDSHILQRHVTKAELIRCITHLLETHSA